MKKNCMLGTALSLMTAALIMSSCAKEDIIPGVPEDSETTTSVTIPFSVTVNGEPETRATVDSDRKTLRFAEGDKLYIFGKTHRGVLDIQTGVGETSGATFSGQLTYTGSKEDPNQEFDILHATLVNAQQEVSVDQDGIVNLILPHEYCATVEEAVQRYSLLTGWSDTNKKSFTLSQGTTFLDFEISFEDGTAAGTEMPAVVTTQKDKGPYFTANVTTRDEGGKVVARFVLPIPETITLKEHTINFLGINISFAMPEAEYWTLNKASVKLGERDPMPFGTNGQMLGGKVYDVKKTSVFAGPMSASPLTVEALTAGTVRVNVAGFLPTSMKYAVNGGEKTLIKASTDIPVSAGDRVQFYDNGTTTQVYGGELSKVSILGGGEGFTCRAYGNIMSLLDEEGFATKTDLPKYRSVFASLFEGNTALTDASDLRLPAMTLSSSCYFRMFLGCTALTQGPDLPATTLADFCYSEMFFGCTTLTKAPELPATTLAESCYDDMFFNCTSLTKAPDLPATTLAIRCYGEMFSGCTSLTKAPDLPAATLTQSCYLRMFKGCTSLSSVKCLAMSGFNENSCTENWLQDVAATGTVHIAGVIWPKGASGIPDGWTGKYEDGSIMSQPHPLEQATTEDIGRVVGANGYIYDTKAIASHEGTTAVAMVAYVGTASNCKHGLALELEEEVGKNWYDARTICSGKTAVPGGTWRLPSEADWQYIVAPQLSYMNPGGGLRKAYEPFADRIKKVTGKRVSGSVYWTSTEAWSDLVWQISFNMYANFPRDKKTALSGVRACLAF